RKVYLGQNFELRKKKLNFETAQEGQKPEDAI
ncbi:MAG: hypothetical protein ACI9YE_003548, partial [Psychroserpens sp.]